MIGKALLQHPDIKGALEKGTLVIVAGTTNGYVAEELLRFLNQAEGFSRTGFRRGITTPPGVKPANIEFPGDVVIVHGEWQRGKTIFDVSEGLTVGDVVLKGANAFDPAFKPALQIAHPQGGTIIAALAALVGRRVKLIVPVGVEKRVMDDVFSLAELCNDVTASGPRLLPFPGDIFTELDGIELLTGTSVSLLAAGGVLGAEGSAWIGVAGTDEQLQAAAELINSVAHEPPCEG